MKEFLRIIAVSIILGSVFATCGRAGQPSLIKEQEKPAGSFSEPGPRSAQEGKWDTVVRKAKQEGAVVVYNVSWPAETRVAVTQRFKEKYGIDLEFSPFNRSADLVAKVRAEKRAGINAVDVFTSGNATFIVVMKPEGLLGDIKSLLVLPEVLDIRVWQGGRIPLADDKGSALSMSGTILRSVVYNTGLVKEGELASYRDLLKPQYKGKITLNDPSVTGAGNAAVAHLGYNLWGEAETVEFLKKLMKDQETVIVRDNRLHMESVARGKYAIGLAPWTQLVGEFLSLGAPIKLAKVKEDNRITTSGGALAIPTEFAHPNAALVFVNWLLTQEGQSIFARNFGSPSTRVDVPTEGIDSLYVPVPGEKYYMESEEWTTAQGKWLEIAKRVMDEIAK